MNEEQWQKVKDIFESALRQTPENRQKFLREICGDDKNLLKEVESLLLSFGSIGGFLEKTAVAEVAEEIVSQDGRFSEGHNLSHYKILKHIGTGGMGAVYLAQDLKLNRRVALKILENKLFSNDKSEKFLLREAQTAATLDHPNICTVYEISEADDYKFIVMQYLEGETLAKKLSAGKLNHETAIDLALQIADALAEAHAHRIIHRDVKPSNVIITEKGQAKVLDFGLAKFLKPEGEERNSKYQSSGGLIMGTVPYMSPEQVRGKTLDAQSDIFSFGTVFYEMLTGKQPFAKENHADTISALLYGKPSFGEIPANVRKTVQRCLMKETSARYQTMSELLYDLQNLSESKKTEPKENFTSEDRGRIDRDIKTETGKNRSWTRFSVLLIIGLIALILLLILMVFYQTKAPAFFSLSVFR